MANRANMAGKRLRSDDDVSHYTALSNEYARGDGRGAIHSTRETIHTAASSEYYLETKPMLPYLGTGSVRSMDGGFRGCSIDNPVVMGVGRSDPTVSMKGQNKGAASGRPEFHIPTEPMSPYLEGVTGFMDDVHGGYSVNSPVVMGFGTSDPTVSMKGQNKGAASGRPEFHIPTEPMSPYLEGVTGFMDDVYGGYSVNSPVVMGVGTSDPTVSMKGQNKGAASGRPEFHIPTEPMSPYLEGVTGFMDDVHGGYSVNSPVVMGVGRSDPTVSMKGQNKGAASGRPEFHIPTEPMSPYLEGVTGFMDDVHGGYSVNSPVVMGVGRSDPTVSMKGQNKGAASGRPEFHIPTEPMSPYLEGVTGFMDDVHGGYSVNNSHRVDHPMEMGTWGSNTAVTTKGQSMRVGVGRAKLPVPHDASSTLFVEGLPTNCTHREASHIFRPFIGFKDLRLATRKQRHPGAGPLVFCFVDFESPAHAAAAKVGLQGYLFDELDRNSARLTLEFARNPGPSRGGTDRKKW